MKICKVLIGFLVIFLVLNAYCSGSDSSGNDNSRSYDTREKRNENGKEKENGTDKTERSKQSVEKKNVIKSIGNDIYDEVLHTFDRPHEIRLKHNYTPRERKIYDLSRKGLRSSVVFNPVKKS